MKHNVRQLHNQGRGGKRATDGRFVESNLTAHLAKLKPKKKEAKPADKTPANSGVDTSEPITLLIAKNPEMNASTFYNLLKSEGFVISSPAVSSSHQQEADSASAFPQMLRAEGGPGSGPQGGRGANGENVKDTPEYDIKKADAKIAKIKDQISSTKAKMDAGSKSSATVDALQKLKDDATARKNAATQKLADLDKSIADKKAKLATYKKKESDQVGFKTRIFLESAQPVTDNKGGTTRYKVVMLEEGMGNFGASAYYSKEALISAIPIFEGKKIYADHPAESEAEERPERSVRDILGHFENVHVSESASGGQQWLCGDLVVMAGSSYQWARELMEHAVAYAKKFPDKEFVGLSINASGDSEEIAIQEAMKRGIPDGAMIKIQEAQAQGIDKLVYVSKFNEAVSCDLVTEAGAGGKILSLIESAKAAEEGGPGSGPQGGSGSKAIDDRKAAQDKASNEKRYAKLYSKQNLESHIKSLMKKSEDKMPPENKEKQEAADKAKQEADAKEAMPAKGEEQGDGEDSAAADDMSLIKKMMKKHGAADDKEEPSDEEASIVKEAYEASKKMGLEGEAAEAKACEYLKQSKFMAEAREAKESAAKEASAGSEGGEDDKKNESAEPAQKESSVKESAGKKGYVKRIEEENAKLAAELSVLRESNKKVSIEQHKEKVCTEAKLDEEVKKTFKSMESVKSAKSVDEVDKCFAIFLETRKTYRKQAAESGLDTTSLFIESEKTSMSDEGATSGDLNFDSMKLED